MIPLNMKPSCLASSLPSFPVMGATQFELEPLGIAPNSYIGRFRAMGSPCEILMRHCSPDQAEHCLDLVRNEAWRIERKFSRYRDDNIVARINQSNGMPVQIDEETGRLLETANSLWNISEGLFDVTSGSLRRAWVFDRSDRVPEPEQVEKLLAFIGWEHVQREADSVVLPEGFEIDFGGIGKEYATDRCLYLARKFGMPEVLVNLGGDIAAGRASKSNEEWSVGVESTQEGELHDATIQFSHGGIATSGDRNKYLLKDGIHYSHVLDPRSGWPVQSAPQSITVAANSCSEAGMYSTLAMLHGDDAEQFLDDCGVRYWIQRR